MKHIFDLILKLIKNHGFFKAVSLLVKMIFYKIKDISFSKKNTRLVLEAVKDKRVVVFTKTIEWNNMFQRSQQLALELSKRENTVVIYVERCTTFDFFSNINILSDSLICYSYRHYHKLDSLLKDCTEIIMYMTNLLDYDNSITLKHDKLVYEYIDELELFFDDIELAQKRHALALNQADVSVATATKLYNQIKECAKNPILSPNAVDYDFFANAKNTPVSPEIKNQISNYDIVIGYYGCLASWFDYETVFAVAKAKPNWLFVMIGIIYDDSTRGYNLNECSNVIFTGAKPYNELPSYISGIDILTIPFLVNNITESTSPVKLFEYMASGTPILTSMLPECSKYKSVYRYTDVDDFIKKAELLYSMKDSDDYRQLLLMEAKANTWETRVTQILGAM